MTKPEKNPLEWAVFAIGLFLSLGTMGLLAWEAIANGKEAAALTVVLGQPTSEGGRYEVPVFVRNRGGETAEAVLVEVVGADGQRVELEFQFVPRGSLRKGAVFLATDPSQNGVTARVVSYRRP